MNKISIFLLVVAVSVVVADEKPKYKMGTQMMFPWAHFKDSKHGGFAIDLANELAKEMNFDYEIYVPADADYGLYDKETDKWSGLIASVMDGTVDFVIVDMIQTPKRKEAVDFSTTFLHSGVGILFALSGREAPGFTNLESLVNSNVPYGTLENGSVMMEISESEDPLMKKVVEYFKAHPENLMKNYQEGIEKAMKGPEKFAFFIDAHWINHLKDKYPQATRIGDVIIPRDYGIVVKKGSPLLSKFNEALAHLEKNGFLEGLVKTYGIGL